MISKILINVDNLEYLDDYRKAGIGAFLFAVKKFSVGYKDFTIEEIDKINLSNKYLFINRILDCQDVDELRKLLKNIKNIKGIVYEDVAVYQIVKELNLNLELIFYQNHFGTNTKSINFWLERVNSVFVSNEITKKEIEEIVSHVKGRVCLHLYGYNQVMYSRRLLLSNWSEQFNVPYKNLNIIEDTATHVKFRAVENEFGTVMYSEYIFNGKDLLGLNNVYYYYVNPTLIPHEVVMDFLTKMARHKSSFEDNGFLEKETIYKLKARNKE